MIQQALRLNLEYGEVEEVFDINNTVAFCKEIQVQFDTLNEDKLSETITPVKLKLIIFRDCLKLRDFQTLPAQDLGSRGAQLSPSS
jgi:hypothetical protein